MSLSNLPLGKALYSPLVHIMCSPTSVDEKRGALRVAAALIQTIPIEHDRDALAELFERWGPDARLHPDELQTVIAVLREPLNAHIA